MFLCDTVTAAVSQQWWVGIKKPVCLQQKLKKDPYITTLGGFSKVTNYIFDAFRGTEEQHQRPPEEVADLLGEVIPGLEINQQEEPGFEVITRVRGGASTHDMYRFIDYIQIQLLTYKF